MGCRMLLVFLFLCLFKQKTAYELRISDWSSDVCSSDLIPSLPALRAHTPDQPVWQQLYMARDRAAMREVLAIVREAKARAIVLTVDLIPDGRTAPPPPPPAFWAIPAPEASFNGPYSGAPVDRTAWPRAEAALPVFVQGRRGKAQRR